MKAYNMPIGVSELNAPILNKINMKRNKGVQETSRIYNPSVKEMENLQDKEVDIKLISGELIQGVVNKVGRDSISLSKHGNWRNKVEVHISSIEDLESSEHPYYSFKHKLSLREEKKPRSPFRYNRNELKELIGKYAMINYDGKVFDGKIVRTIYKKNQSECNVIIVESIDGETKEIQDYRLRDLEITGENYNVHQGVLIVKNLESDLHIQLEERFSGGCSDALDKKKVEPDTLLEKYFEARISELKGIEVDFKYFDYNWANEVLDRDTKVNGKLSKPLYDDVKKARSVNEYYTTRKEFIDFIIDKVESIDWTTYYKKQKKGVIDALEYIYESNVITS